MNLSTLQNNLQAAIQANTTLPLTVSIPGATDLESLISNNLHLSSLSIKATSGNLTIQQAPTDAIKVKGTAQPSLFVEGAPDGVSEILGLTLDQIESSWVYFTPTASSTVNFTLIFQLKKGWEFGDSFPILKEDYLFDALVAETSPFLILTNFEHEQSWTDANSNAQSFNCADHGLFIQMPSEISIGGSDILTGLFHEITGTLLFNGKIDNTKTQEAPNNLSISVQTELAGKNVQLSGKSGKPIHMEFDIGMEVFPVQAEPNADNAENKDKPASILSKSQLFLIGKIGKVQ